MTVERHLELATRVAGEADVSTCSGASEGLALHADAVTPCSRSLSKNLMMSTFFTVLYFGSFFARF